MINKEMKPIRCKNCKLEIAKSDGENIVIDGEIIRVNGLNPFVYGFVCNHRTIRNKKEQSCKTQHTFMRRCGNLYAVVF